MELRHLMYFEAVARHMHMTRAASELHVAQPALSKQIQSLEEELGVPLFERIGRGIQLTPAGAALLPHARRILSAVEDARAEIAEQIGLRKGKVTLGAPPTASIRLLPPALAAFHAEYPGIELALRQGGANTIVAMVERGDVDVGVVMLPVPEGTLESLPLVREELVLAVADTHSLAGHQSVAMSALAEERFVLFPEGYELREALLNACRRAGFMPRIVLDGGEVATVLPMVASGIGVALVPAFSTGGTPNLATLHISDQQLERQLGLVWRNDRSLAPAARALREVLRRELAQG
jgi:LysR family transcriptional regulator, transcription activator of glutamate synthase operon